MTYKTESLSIFAIVIVNQGINELYTIAFTHRNLSVNDIGLLHIDPENQQDKLSRLKEKLSIKELMFLSTCNRVEFMIVTEEEVNHAFLLQFFEELYPDFTKDKQNNFATICELHQGMNAVSHQLSVASSLDSMIVGEREIITQVRSAYEASKEMELS